MGHFIKYIFWVCIAKPITCFIIGLNIRHKEKIPKNGPCIIIANHNSHLDTLVLFNLFPVSLIDKIKPVAAADYFLKNKIMKWFSEKIIGIIPIQRSHIRKSINPFEKIIESLRSDSIVIMFPEGTRGQPEHMQPLKKGIINIVEQLPHIPIVPIFLYGLGKSLPKGEGLLVPFTCDVFVGDSISLDNDPESFLMRVEAALKDLSKENEHADWS